MDFWGRHIYLRHRLRFGPGLFFVRSLPVFFSRPATNADDPRAIALPASEQLLLGKLTHGLLGRGMGQGFFFPGSRDARAVRER
jgi:hypothetical protein